MFHKVAKSSLKASSLNSISEPISTHFEIVRGLVKIYFNSEISEVSFRRIFYTFCNVLQEAQNKDSNVKLIKLDSLIIQCAPKKVLLLDQL